MSSQTVAIFWRQFMTLKDRKSSADETAQIRAATHASILPQNNPHVGYFRHSAEFGSWLHVDRDCNVLDPTRSTIPSQIEDDFDKRYRERFGRNTR